MNAPRSGCPINLSLEMLGDRWSLIVIRDLRFGNRRHFRELLTRSEADSLEHSGRPADAPGESRIGIPSRRSQPQAEGHLQPDRNIHRWCPCWPTWAAGACVIHPRRKSSPYARKSLRTEARSCGPSSWRNCGTSTSRVYTAANGGIWRARQDSNPRPLGS
jgi:hypothetical protein